MRCSSLVAIAGVLVLTTFVESQSKAAKAYVDAVAKINQAHARRPGKKTEDELAKKLPKSARLQLDRVLKKGDAASLAAVGEAALELCRMEDFGRIRAALGKVSESAAVELGTALVRPRYLLRGLGGLAVEDLKAFAPIMDAILDTYDKHFAFREWSKVPGKRIRVRIRKVDQITRPPYFDPSPRFHSTIDYPVLSLRPFLSPTKDGKFLLYGMCHELGHLIAMWGDRRTMADHHAWAHYTGVVICEALSKTKKLPKALKKAVRKLRDVRWRSLSKDRKDHRAVAPSLDDQKGVLSLLIRLHDAVGAKVIGKAMNRLDQKKRGHRINHVRYYSFAEFRRALLAVTKSKKHHKAIKRLLP